MITPRPLIPLHAASATMQYTSLMLLLLTFLVVSFSKYRPSVDVAEPPLRRVIGPELPVGIKEPVVIGQYEYQDIFDSETGELNTEPLSALAQVIRSHDIGAKVFVRYGGADRESAQVRIGRMVSLARWLEALNVPMGAYEISGAEHDGSAEIAVELWGEPDDR